VNIHGAQTDIRTMPIRTADHDCAMKAAPDVWSERAVCPEIVVRTHPIHIRMQTRKQRREVDELKLGTRWAK